PEMHIKTSQLGMLSPDGKCYTFDNRANGFVPGEGVGAVMLKRLEDAERNRDNIIGVIEGWGVNQDGKSNGITAPNEESQASIERNIYKKFKIDPAAIQLVEAHGTGTKLGDPIEVAALKQSFGAYTKKNNFCALGSVKSNIGHCLTAAGIAGFIKCMQALRNKQLPPTIHYQRLNEHISLENSPFYVNTQLRPWEVNGTERRRAAISAFGFSGTNAHLVVSEYMQPAEMKTRKLLINQNGKVAVPLSAKSTEQLYAKVKDLLNFIEGKNDSELDIIEIAYTLQIGREAMDERMGILAESINQLVRKLSDVLEGKKDLPDIYFGRVTQYKESLSIFSQDPEMRETVLAMWMERRNISKILELWVKGLAIDWNMLYGEIKPRRVVLPNYPFARERYWVCPEDYECPNTTRFPNRAPHPLVHVNTSDFSRQSYSSVFCIDDFFLKDHKVALSNGNYTPVVPGAVYLETARAAIGHAAVGSYNSMLIELCDIVWLRPLKVPEKKIILTALYAQSLDSRDTERIEFEIATKENDEEIVHCKGRAKLVEKVSGNKLNLEEMKIAANRGKLTAEEIYEKFTDIGFAYGPSHRIISSIHLGYGQVLAYLELPEVIMNTIDDYILHPALIDGALQAAIGIYKEDAGCFENPAMPFALRRLAIKGKCTKRMVAWLRYSTGDRLSENNLKLDIDICNLDGRICVQIQAFEARIIKRNEKENVDIGFNSPTERTGTADIMGLFNEEYYRNIIDRLAKQDISVETALGME
ncbi:MAG: polyketide synthase of type I, partial [Chitinivibrionales bacterium]|nr:polyketide synthase of type I [Chitinivibrionales bacterium]